MPHKTIACPKCGNTKKNLEKKKGETNERLYCMS